MKYTNSKMSFSKGKTKRLVWFVSMYVIYKIAHLSSHTKRRECVTWGHCKITARAPHGQLWYRAILVYHRSTSQRTCKHDTSMQLIQARPYSESATIPLLSLTCMQKCRTGVFVLWSYLRFFIIWKGCNYLIVSSASSCEMWDLTSCTNKNLHLLNSVQCLF